MKLVVVCLSRGRAPLRDDASPAMRKRFCLFLGPDYFKLYLKAKHKGWEVSLL